MSANTPPRVYIASRFLNRDAVAALTLKLATAKRPWHCIQTWHNESELSDPSENAMRDLREIDSADIVLVLTMNCENVPGGMHFEAGYACAKEKCIIVVGPKVNIFYHLPSIVYVETLQEFLSEFEWSDIVLVDNTGSVV